MADCTRFRLLCIKRDVTLEEAAVLSGFTTKVLWARVQDESLEGAVTAPSHLKNKSPRMMIDGESLLDWLKAVKEGTAKRGRGKAPARDPNHPRV